jgi:hypothetical protein
MKHSLALMTLFITGTAIAQQYPQVMPFNKKYLDSLLGSAQKKNQPLVIPNPFANADPGTVNLNTPPGFEDYNPGATVINKTSRGTIYNMPLDNMAVLVPNMNTVENMPGSSNYFKSPPRTNMPNPLYPPKVSPRKKKQ